MSDDLEFLPSAPSTLDATEEENLNSDPGTSLDLDYTYLTTIAENQNIISSQISDLNDHVLFAMYFIGCIFILFVLVVVVKYIKSIF